MKRSPETQEESLEQMFAEVGSHLVEAEEILLPSLEAKVRDVRSLCQKAYDALSRLEHRVVIQKRKK